MSFANLKNKPLFLLLSILIPLFLSPLLLFGIIRRFIFRKKPASATLFFMLPAAANNEHTPERTPAPNYLRIAHQLTSLDLAASASAGTGAFPQHLRCYNLQKNEAREVAVLIMAEVVTSGMSGMWLEQTANEEQLLREILLPYNIYLAQSGVWLNELEFMTNRAYEMTMEKIQAAVAEFTAITGLPVHRLIPRISSCVLHEGQKGRPDVIEFLLEVDVSSCTPLPQLKTETYSFLQQGIWTVPVGTQVTDIHRLACKTLMDTVIEVLDQYTGETGCTIRLIDLSDFPQIKLGDWVEKLVVPESVATPATVAC
jgi:hypothetical protein